MNFTKGIKGLALTTALVGGISFLPTNAGAETLGWSEETGYVNTDENVMYSPVMYASSKPDSHRAKIDHYSPSQMNTRKVTGYTTWSGKNHYTRARFDNGGSKVAADSGRKYGYNSSELSYIGIDWNDAYMNIRKKINTDDLLLGIVVALTILMLLIVSSYFFKKNEMDKLTNGLYSSTNFRFSMKESEGNNSLHKFIKQTKQSNYILFKENIEKPNIRGVYSSQTLNTIPMKSGRFFQKEDFFHNKKLAVVGKEFKDIENISGKKFVNYKGHKFEVIGTIGGEVKSEVDNIIYLNLDALWDLNINSTGIYVIDGNDDGEKLFSTLESILGKDSVFPIEDKGKGSKRLFENNFIDNSMIFLLFIIALMMNILSTSYWIYKKRILISIQHFIGHKSFYIYRSLYYKYIFISICSYSIGFVLFLIFNIKLYNDHIYTYNKLFFIGILFMLIFTIGICIVSSCIYTKKNCIKVLKSN